MYVLQIKIQNQQIETLPKTVKSVRSREFVNDGCEMVNEQAADKTIRADLKFSVF